MPQCQRSPNCTVLPVALFEVAPGVVRCPDAPYSPGCPGNELYIALPSGPLTEYFAESIASCAPQFAVELDNEPTTLWLGHGPLTIYSDTACYEVYVQQGSDLDQYRYQLGHEAFHRVCGCATRHWTREMLPNSSRELGYEKLATPHTRQRWRLTLTRGRR
jgi:hypothetical protein